MIHKVDPILITQDNTIRSIREISLTLGKKMNDIVNPGINNIKKKPKRILKNPKRVVIISAMSKPPA
jgi:hypothetical protein